MTEGPPSQGTDPTVSLRGSASGIGCGGCTSDREQGHFPDGLFPVPPKPPPFPLLCQAQLQDSWLTMKIATMKKQ